MSPCLVSVFPHHSASSIGVHNNKPSHCHRLFRHDEECSLVCRKIWKRALRSCIIVSRFFSPFPYAVFVHEARVFPFSGTTLKVVPRIDISTATSFMAVLSWKCYLKRQKRNIRALWWRKMNYALLFEKKKKNGCLLEASFTLLV